MTGGLPALSRTPSSARENRGGSTGSKNGQAEAEALRTEKEALEARPKELEALAETQRGDIADLEGRAKAAETRHSGSRRTRRRRSFNSTIIIYKKAKSTTRTDW